MRLRPYYIFLLLLTPSFLFSQSVSVNLTASKNQILIGEPIRLQLEATVPEGTQAGWFETDSIAHFELVTKVKIDTVAADAGIRYRQAVTLTSFDSGRWTIPPLALTIGDRSYLTDSVVVDVSYAPFDPAQPYHDIKNILDVENPSLRTINWVIGALTLLSLLAVVYFLRKRLPVAERPALRKPAAIQLSTLEEALQALETLRKQRLAEQGQVKLYYTSLNDILRSFVQKKMSASMMEKTNDELVIQLKRWGLANDDLISLAQTLRMSDAVKFAKFVPGEQDNEQSYQTIKASLEAVNNLK